MGQSKSYRGGPGWEGRNQPGADPKVSKGPVAKPESEAMSSGTMREGMKGSARNKSKPFKGPGKKPPYSTGYA